MKEQPTVTVLERQVHIHAGPATVFAHFTEPMRLTSWMGWRAELDPRPGGVFRVEYLDPDQVVSGEFIELDPPHRLVFTWGWENEASSGSTTVTVDITPEEDGCLLELGHDHHGVPTERAERDAASWDQLLPQLAAVAAQHGDTSVIAKEVHISAGREVVYGLLTDPEQMPRWMGRQTDLDPRPGGIYRVVMNDVFVARGEFVRVEPPSFVSHTWGWEGDKTHPPGSSTITYLLAEDNGGTLLRVLHRLVPTGTLSDHDEALAEALEALAAAARI
jgi:uncharacterized protein YndB with AHSA1/START domain